MLTKTQKGFSLIELMIAVGVLGVIAAVAVPFYSDYIATARIGVMQDNIKGIRLMQDARRRTRGEFAEGTYIPGGAATLTTNLGWQPGTSADVISYVVTCTTDGATAGECARTSGYSVVATHQSAPTEPVTVNVPAP